MRIFSIIQCANLGGIRRPIWSFPAASRLAGHEIELLSLNAIVDLKPLLDERAVPAQGPAYRGRVGRRGLLTRAALGFLCNQARAERLMWKAGRRMAKLLQSSNMLDACAVFWA